MNSGVLVQPTGGRGPLREVGWFADPCSLVDASLDHRERGLARTSNLGSPHATLEMDEIHVVSKARMDERAFQELDYIAAADHPASLLSSDSSIQRNKALHVSSQA